MEGPEDAALGFFVRGERAFVIGNGPSRNKFDLKFLKDEVTFGVNEIYLNYETMGYHPTYYVLKEGAEF